MNKLASFPKILTHGGDDRLVLNAKTGVNKYFCSPELPTDVMFRGSCTCNLPTPLGYGAAEKAYSALSSGNQTIDALMESSR